MKELIRTVGLIQDSVHPHCRAFPAETACGQVLRYRSENLGGTGRRRLRHRGGVAEKALHLGMAERVLLESLLTFPDLIREVREFFTADILALLNSRNLIRQMIDVFDRRATSRSPTYPGS